MRFSEAATLLSSIVSYNLAQYEAQAGHDTYLVPIIVGDPGLGKTAIPKYVAKQAEIRYFQTIVAQYDAGEMAGLPFMGEKKITWTDADGTHTDVEHQMIRLRPDFLPDINDPDEQIGIYNLDELPQAFLANQNIVSQLVNEYRIGKHKVSTGITMCCTGNKPENKAGTTAMPSHLKDRLLFIDLESNTDDWLIYAAQVGIDFRIRAFIRNNPGELHKFTTGAVSNPTPRSWEKTSAIINLGNPQGIRTQAIAGQIGVPAGTLFESWLRVEDKMPRLEDVIAFPEDPIKAPVFGNSQPDILYILLAALADRADDQNIGNILKYIKRLPNQEFAAYWAQDCFQRDPKLLQNRDVTKWKLTDGMKIMG